MAKVRRPEQALHIGLVAFLRRALPPEIVFFHCANGGKRTKAEAGLLKAMGVVAGVPDLCMIMPNGQIGFLELKAAGGLLSDAQVEFRERVLKLNCGYATARTMEEAEDVITRWLAAFDLKPRATLVRRAAA